MVLRVFLAAQNRSYLILLPVSLLVMVAVGAVAVLGFTVSRERVFLENLGVGRSVTFLVAFLFTGALEGAAALAGFVAVSLA
jgi:hypothetical protein